MAEREDNIKALFEKARRLVLAGSAPTGCPEVADAVLGETPNPASEFVIGWPGTDKQSNLFHCFGRGDVVCDDCPLRTDPNDPTYFKRVNNKVLS